MKILIVGLLLACYQAEAGEWFKSVEIKAGVGTEWFKCRDGTCGNYDIGKGPIGKFSIAQSIYSNKNLVLEIEWDHMSAINTQIEETPIDYFGFNLSVRHNWY